jgi:WhiB family redox-sensing transcriptional regulator
MTPRIGAGESVAAGTALAIPGPWADRALCAQADPDPRFREKGQYALGRVAQQICGHCPVRKQCLDYALSGGDTWGGMATGIWGGTTAKERDQMRRQRKAAA